MRLARRPFRSATGRSPALSAEMNLGRVPCTIQINRFQNFSKVLKSGAGRAQPMPPFTAPRMNTAAVSTQKRYLYSG